MCRLPRVMPFETYWEGVTCDLGHTRLGRLQRWPVSKRVNSSKAVADDATLIEWVELATA
jgi:hypothetical protein